jgi:hypothetical protein
MPNVPPVLNAANIILMPLATPRFVYNGMASKMQPNAVKERKKSFAAKSEAAY